MRMGIQVFFRLFFILYTTVFSVNAFSTGISCDLVFTKFSSPRPLSPSTSSLRWFESLVDSVGPFGVRDLGVTFVNAIGIRPTHAFRGLGGVFVLRPKDLNLDQAQLQLKAARLWRLVQNAREDYASGDEKAVAYFLIQQFRYLTHEQNFNVFARQAKSWAETFEYSFVNDGDQRQPWASSVLNGLRRIKFILKVPLPKSKNVFPDDDGPKSIEFAGDGTMAVFESGELDPSQIASFVYRVKYNDRWHWPNGPLRSYWGPLLVFQQKAVEFLAKSDEQLTARDMFLQIKKIYSETAENFR